MSTATDAGRGPLGALAGVPGLTGALVRAALTALVQTAGLVIDGLGWAADPNNQAAFDAAGRPGGDIRDWLAQRIVDGTEPEQKKAKPPRTHWDMLLERRSMAELDDILNERLEEVRARRGRAS